MMPDRFIASSWANGTRLPRLFASAAVVALAFTGFSYSDHHEAGEKSAEVDLGVHRLETTTTAPFDAFAHVNRVPQKLEEGETPASYAGVILYSRLRNIEGRIQVKVLEGFDGSAYFGFKTFLRTWQDKPEEGVGNCVSCHVPTTFSDDLEHIVDESEDAKATVSLRNLKKSDKELEAIVRGKMKMAEMAHAGKGNIDDAYKAMSLKDKDVKQLVSFLQSLNEISKGDFRQIILDAEILDTRDLSYTQ